MISIEQRYSKSAAAYVEWLICL